MKRFFTATLLPLPPMFSAYSDGGKQSIKEPSLSDVQRTSAIQEAPQAVPKRSAEGILTEENPAYSAGEEGIYD